MSKILFNIVRTWNKYRPRRWRKMNQLNVPSIFMKHDSDEYDWQHRWCLYPCKRCYAMTTSTFIKKDIPVLIFCYMCQFSYPIQAKDFQNGVYKP